MMVKNWTQSDGVYSYWWCTDVNMYTVNRKGHTICFTESEWRAKQIIRLLRCEYDAPYSIRGLA